MPIKYLFCINSGRSGSDYLTELLCHVEKTVSLHEGWPTMNGKAMEAFNEGDEAPMLDLMPAKIKAINKKRRQGTIYCETNHTFIKGFGYLLPDRYIPQEEIGVIILKRQRNKVINSMLRVRDIPGKTAWSRNWYLSPGQKQNLIPFDQKSNPIVGRCEWYLDEIDARAEEYQKRFPSIKYFSVDLESLNDVGKVETLLTFFGLKPKDSLWQAVGKPLNVKAEFPPLNNGDEYKSEGLKDPDLLPHKERDRLLKEMINYLLLEKKSQIEALNPDWTAAGSYAGGVNKMVTYAEDELEDKFQYRIRYSDMERTLIHEMLYTLYPKDLLLLTFERHTTPNIHYSYDFNKIPALSVLWKKLGFSGIWNMVKAVTKAPSLDFTHKAERHQNIPT